MVIRAFARHTVKAIPSAGFVSIRTALPWPLSTSLEQHCRYRAFTSLSASEIHKKYLRSQPAARGQFQSASRVEHQELDPGLYLVATPIGNLEDITLRALRILKSASVILAEDTRHSQKLLSFHGIQTRTVSFHEHNEREKESKVMELLRGGQAVALISDAGMPLISDPGSVLVRKAAESGIKIVPIPGPSAILSALVASGLPTNHFQFCGFLPPKQIARQKAIQILKDSSATLVFFVPPHSLVSVISDLAEALGADRKCVVARELTKVYEEFCRGTLEEVLTDFDSRNPRGEITLVVEGCGLNGLSPSAAMTDAQIDRHLKTLLSKGSSASAAAKKISKDLNLPKNRVYNLVTQLKLDDADLDKSE